MERDRGGTARGGGRVTAPALAALSDIMHDRRPSDPGYKRALRKQRRASRRRDLSLSFGATLYGCLAVTGWTATTVLTTAGLFVALFLAAGNGTLAGFFEQVALLSTHYGEAERSLQSGFDSKLMAAFGLVFVVTAFFRRGALLNIFRTGGVDGPR